LRLLLPTIVPAANPVCSCNNRSQPPPPANVCVTCPAGHVCSGSMAPCPAGSFSAAGASTCSPCPENHYCPGTGNASPVPCLAGKVSAAGASSCQTYCTASVAEKCTDKVQGCTLRLVQAQQLYPPGFPFTPCEQTCVPGTPSECTINGTTGPLWYGQDGYCWPYAADMGDPEVVCNLPIGGGEAGKGAAPATQDCYFNNRCTATTKRL
jgi:hypothetical protein